MGEPMWVGSSPVVTPDSLAVVDIDRDGDPDLVFGGASLINAGESDLLA